MSDPNDLGIVNLLRPYKNFENDYDRIGGAPQTISGAYPIAFSWPANPDPVGVGVADAYAYDEDARAARVGYSPKLGAMCPCPIGASILFYIPVIPGVVYTEPDGDGNGRDETLASWVYLWKVVWRIQTTDKLRYHKPGSLVAAPGAPNSLPGGGARIVVPSASESMIYVRREPDTGSTVLMGAQYFFSEGLAVVAACPLSNQPAGMHFGVPLQPLGDIYNLIDHQQGMLDPAVGGAENVADLPPAIPYWQKAAGNELALWCYKYEYKDPSSPTILVPRDWDFDFDPATGSCDPNAEDAILSTMFGVGTSASSGPFPNIGVFVAWGNTGI
jgi:hypothetical protein